MAATARPPQHATADGRGIRRGDLRRNPPSAPRLEWMQRKFRLQRASEFQRVRRHGTSHAHPLMVVVVAPSAEVSFRIGVTASRAVGTAVNRNRARRRLRAALHPLLPALRPGIDLVITARRPLLEASWAEVCAALRVLLHRAGCLITDNEQSGTPDRV